MPAGDRVYVGSVQVPVPAANLRCASAGGRDMICWLHARHTFARARGHRHTHSHSLTHTHTHTYTHAHTGTHAHTHAHTHAYTQTHTSVRAHTHTHEYTHRHAHAHTNTPWHTLAHTGRARRRGLLAFLAGSSKTPRSCCNAGSGCFAWHTRWHASK